LLNQTVRKRLIIFIIIASFSLVPLFFRLVQIMLLTPQARSDTFVSRQPLERGPILDRNGKILAIETKLKSITGWIPDITEPRETAEILAEICKIEKKNVSKILASSNGFVYIRRKVPSEMSDKIVELKKEGKLKGINLENEYSRVYPQGEIGSHLVGYVDIDERGLDGVERTFDEELGQDPSLGDEATAKSAVGNQVFLTIDINLQASIEGILEKAYKENDADSCLAVVMNAKTGEILAYCSVPMFDPNDIAHSTERERINHITIQAYEPGSVFKVFSISSFLEAGGITKDDEFYCNGVYDKIKSPITCPTAHGKVSALEIIKYSCNVGAAYASETVSTQAFYKILSNWGFGSKTGIELPGETAGILNNVSKWSGRSKPSIAFGQEISVSALQIMQAASALTNNGIMLKPQVAKKIVSPSGKLVREFARHELRQVLSPRTAWLMLQMMKSTTSNNGTAKLAAVEGLDISAKTGTAQVYDPKTKKYSETNYTASILGIFPTDDPAFIAYTVIQNPKAGSYHSSRIAAPLFKEIAESILRILKVSTKETKVIEHPEAIEVKSPDEVVLGDTMPNLIGKPKRLILSLFAREDIVVQIKGEGNVVRQSPEPGTAVKEGTKIILELK
jgi:cell division protein FtsI (penicillin-binding protein 3)